MGGIDTRMAYPQRCVRFCSATLFCRFWMLQPHSGGGKSRRRWVEVVREAFGKVGKGDLVVFANGGGCACLKGGRACLNQVWWASLLAVDVVVKALGYIWLVSIDLFGIGLKSQGNLLPGNPSCPASVTACYCNLVLCNMTRGAWACVEISPPLQKHLRLLSCCFVCLGLSNAIAVQL